MCIMWNELSPPSGFPMSLMSYVQLADDPPKSARWCWFVPHNTHCGGLYNKLENDKYLVKMQV